MTQADGPRERDPSIAELLTALSEQTKELVREELALVKAEMTSKAKHAGIGVGLFSTAGVLALYGLGALIATAILALALALPSWLAALIVALVIFAAAGVAALVGRKQLGAATPVAPERSITNVKRDVETVKEARQHDHAPH